MDRRLLVAGGATVAVVVLLVVASSSGPARLWTSVATGPPGPGAAPLSTVDRQADDAVDDDEEKEPPGTFGWLEVASTTIATAIVVAGIASVRRTGWPDRLRHALTRRRWHGSPLPEADDGRLTIDVEEARAALRTGAPRNAIVACWQRLERDAAEVGMERWASETSTEYVERVIASTSTGAGPIRALAALYREARFSSHALDDGHRSSAIDALEQVLAAVHADAGAAR